MTSGAAAAVTQTKEIAIVNVARVVATGYITSSLLCGEQKQQMDRGGRIGIGDTTSMCLPSHACVAYLFLFRSETDMPTEKKPINPWRVFFSVVYLAIAVSIVSFGATKSSIWSRDLPLTNLIVFSGVFQHLSLGSLF